MSITYLNFGATEWSLEGWLTIFRVCLKLEILLTSCGAALGSIIWYFVFHIGFWIISSIYGEGSNAILVLVALLYAFKHGIS